MSPDSPPKGSDLFCDQRESNRLHRIREYPSKIRPFSTLLVLFFCAQLLACRAPTEEAPVDDQPPQPAATSLRCVDGGGLRTDLYGAIEGTLDWFAAPTVCEGMPRPNDEGARLRFSGPHPTNESSLVFIVAIPSLTKGTTGEELPTALTIIEEGESRFFTAPGTSGCWTDIFTDELLDNARHAITGRITCISALGEVRGSSAVTISDLHFTGVIDWSAS